MQLKGSLQVDMTDTQPVNKGQSNENCNDLQRSAERSSSLINPTPTRKREPRYKNMLHLWEFLLELLADESCRSIICWKKKESGEFKLVDHHEVAKRWGILKQKGDMNYSKLSRALRLYYQQGIIRKVKGQMLVYKFYKLPYKYEPGVTRSAYREQFQRMNQSPHRPPERKSRAFLPRSSPATSLIVSDIPSLGKGFSWPIGSMPSPHAYWFPDPVPCVSSLCGSKSRIYYPASLPSQAVGLSSSDIADYKAKAERLSECHLSSLPQ